MIKELCEIEDITKILQLDDDVLEKAMPCSKGEWVQWLCQNIDNPKIKIFIDFDDGDIMGYIVLIDSVIPPIFDSVSILYLWSPCSHKITRKLIEKSKEWAKSIGAKKGIISIPIGHTEKYISKFGGEKIAYVYEWRVS